MIAAVLFDLDNTLLDSDMEVFLPPYFAALSKHMAKLVDPHVFTDQLMASTQAMVDNNDASITNQMAFEADFLAAFDELSMDLPPEFDRFYEEGFPKLRQFTSPRPEARRLVERLLADDYRVVIATNPLFPRRAVQHRLDWAGVGDLPLTFLTTYENSHFCKPNPDYYREILGKLDCEPDEAIMIGDSLENDILPAEKIGLCTYWIHDGSSETAHSGFRGTLADCAAWVTEGGLRAL